MNKTALLTALQRFIAQKPGLEFANYDDWSLYRSEMRSITKDRHQAETLLRYVALRDSITAEMIVQSCRGAFSGRLTIEPLKDGQEFSIQYCTGQDFPTEYRRAVCAVLASAIWDWLRDSMPKSDGMISVDIGGKPLEIEGHQGLSPGDWLRQAAKRELGRTIANRWLS